MKQKGFILIVSLIFMAIMSMLAIYMFSGFTMDETLSGNHREKSRSLDAAQTALDYADNWLGQSGNTYTGNWITGTTCTTTSSTPVICSNALTNPTTLPWTSYTGFTPSGMVVNAAGGIGTYAANPNLYIQYLGTTNANPPTAMYQVTATAQGGNTSAAAVVQAVYQVTAASIDLSGG
jgi:type IV pilus assembly protein PilX